MEELKGPVTVAVLLGWVFAAKYMGWTEWWSIPAFVIALVLSVILTKKLHKY